MIYNTVIIHSDICFVKSLDLFSMFCTIFLTYLLVQLQFRPVLGVIKTEIPKEVFNIKKKWKITAFTLLAALLMSFVIPVYAEEIPRESLLRGTPPGSIAVAERLVSGILDEVTAGFDPVRRL